MLRSSLDVVFPADYRAMMRSQDGFTEDGASATLIVHPLTTMVETSEDIRQYVSGQLPRALLFGSDGSRESLVWNLRKSVSPVYLVDITNAGWDKALLQAPSPPR